MKGTFTYEEWWIIPSTLSCRPHNTQYSRIRPLIKAFPGFDWNNEFKKQINLHYLH